MIAGSSMSKREFEAANEVGLAQAEFRFRMNRRLGRVVNMSALQYRQLGFRRHVH